jgi:uncharacterized protein YndB with AHSA1/START domain
MVSSAVTPNHDSIQAEVLIAAPPERVFQALVEPQQVVQWWGQAGIYHCTEFSSDLRVGGKWRGAGVGGQNDRFTVSGEYWRSMLLVCSRIPGWQAGLAT